MRIEIKMPRMGQTMVEGTVIRWVKSAGAKVKVDEPIVIIETDKAVVEYASRWMGTLVETNAEEGQKVPVGETIAVIEDGKPAPAKAPSPAVRLKSIQESSTQVKPQRGVDEPVNASPFARRLAQEHNLDLGRVIGTGPEGRISKEDVEAYLASRAEKTHKGLILQPEGRPKTLKASPAARVLAKAQGVDIALVDASGPDGLIQKADVEAWIEAHESIQTPPISDEGLEYTSAHLSNIKLATARNMIESKAKAPHFYISMDIEMSRALDLRESLKSRGQDISVNDLILRATVISLLQHPGLNATVSGEEIRRYSAINMSVAIDLNGEGLITPVIHHCESLSLADLAQASRSLIERARSGKFRQDDLSGGTFTVSNLGMFGIKQFEAIINPPQAAILACGAIRRLPRFDKNDRVVPAQIITVTLSSDHRLTDGAQIARFLQTLKDVLEDGYSLQ